MSGAALVLAGHGSHISARTAGVVWGYVDALRALGVADEITACFWKEPPAFSQVLDTLESAQVVVVPLFTASGYFTRQVIPMEMGLQGMGPRTPNPAPRSGKPPTPNPSPTRGEGLTTNAAAASLQFPPSGGKGLTADPVAAYLPFPPCGGKGLGDGGLIRRGKRIHLTPPIGEHPQLDSIVDRRLRDMLSRHNLTPSRTAAAIIGHGTPRSPSSRDATRRQARRIRDLGIFAQVVDAYLDDQPDIPSIYARTRARHIVALPWFLAAGSHVTRDVPRALGINGAQNPAAVGDRLLHYCPPVGDDESICEVILALARSTGLAFAERIGAREWDGFPRAGRRELLSALDAGETLRFGQVYINRQRVWHADGAAGNPIDNPAELRKIAREAPFRPLPTRRNLPGGWHVRLDNPRDAHAVLDTIYPSLVADWAAQKQNRPQIESLEDIGKRQEGMFKDIHLLPTEIIERTVNDICGDCVRQPTWHGVSGELPCRAPCNWWLSAARKNERRSA